MRKRERQVCEIQISTYFEAQAQLSLLWESSDTTWAYMELQHMRKFMCGLMKCGYLAAIFFFFTNIIVLFNEE